MLTAAQRDLIKATVPLLETGGEALTKHFYGLMLTESDAARPLFNQAHQSSGDQPPGNFWKIVIANDWRQTEADLFFF